MSETKTTTPAAKAARPTWKPAGRVHAGEQPFTYPLKREFVEPDWRRLPGYKGVSEEEWETALWQRRHTVKNLKELKDAFGEFLPDALMASLERDIKERATMSILVPPHMLNTMDEKDLWNDPVRRYMLPAFDDRHPEWPSHPKASRDSLHESDMWAVEGLTHRYPTKVLAEMLSTCPQTLRHWAGPSSRSSTAITARSTRSWPPSGRRLPNGTRCEPSPGAPAPRHTRWPSRLFKATNRLERSPTGLPTRA